MGDLNKPRDIQAKFCLRLDPESAFKEGWDSAMEYMSPRLERLKEAEDALNYIVKHISPTALAYVKKWGIDE